MAAACILEICLKETFYTFYFDIFRIICYNIGMVKAFPKLQTIYKANMEGKL